MKNFLLFRLFASVLFLLFSIVSSATVYNTVGNGNWNDSSRWNTSNYPSFVGGLSNDDEINIYHTINLNGDFLGNKSIKFNVFEGGKLTITGNFRAAATIDVYVDMNAELIIGTEPTVPDFDFCDPPLNHDSPIQNLKPGVSLFWVEASNLSPSLVIGRDPNGGATNGKFILYGHFLVSNKFDISIRPNAEFIVKGDFGANNNAEVSIKGAGGSIGCDMIFKNKATINMNVGNLSVGGDMLFMNGGTIEMTGSSIVVGGQLCSSPGQGNALLYISGDPAENFIVVGEPVTSDCNINSNVPIITPIELLSFTPEIKPDRINLNWITGTEINNDYYTIERSRDLYGWEVLGFVQGAGNSSVPLSYSFSDMRPLDGLAYYRLKQTDFDGKFEYFGPIAAHYDLGMEGLDFKVLKQYTNWVIAVPNDGIYQVEVYNLMGHRLVSERTENTLTIPAPEGAVVIRVTDGFERSASRVVM